MAIANTIVRSLDVSFGEVKLVLSESCDELTLDIDTGGGCEGKAFVTIPYEERRAIYRFFMGIRDGLGKPEEEKV